MIPAIATPTLPAPNAPTPRPEMNEATLRKTARDFEAMALGQMLQPMFEGVAKGGFFGGGTAEQTWQPLLVNEYAKIIAEGRGLGIADSVLRQMLSMQEKTQ